MNDLLTAMVAFAMGYWIGKRVGIAMAMSRMQGIIEDLERIKPWRRTWNEDDL